MFHFLLIFLLSFNFITGMASENVFNETVQFYMKKLNIQGVVLGVFLDGKEEIITYGLADQQENKPMTPETLFRIASLSKVFTTTELALQVQQGTMSLKDPLKKYIPNAPRQITLLELATHSSGLPKALPKADSRQKILDFLIGEWDPKTSKKRYLYSNIGFGILGFAIENATHLSYFNLIKKDILDPLNMNHTFVIVPESEKGKMANGYLNNGRVAKPQPIIMPASGGLTSNCSDLMKFLRANLNLVGPENLRKAMQTTQKKYLYANDQLQMGLAWQRVTINDMLIIDKNGGLPGFSSYMGMIPEKKCGIVILANKAKINITFLGRQLLELIQEKMLEKEN